MATVNPGDQIQILQELEALSEESGRVNDVQRVTGGGSCGEISVVSEGSECSAVDQQDTRTGILDTSGSCSSARPGSRRRRVWAALRRGRHRAKDRIAEGLQFLVVLYRRALGREPPKPTVHIHVPGTLDLAQATRIWKTVEGRFAFSLDPRNPIQPFYRGAMGEAELADLCDINRSQILNYGANQALGYYIIFRQLERRGLARWYPAGGGGRLYLSTRLVFLRDVVLTYRTVRMPDWQPEEESYDDLQDVDPDGEAPFNEYPYLP